ncbi:MAG: glyoxalase [Bacteroidota bacterium]
MVNREKLIALRPSLSLDQASSEVEQFQNEVLRPILKFQHELLLAIFQHYVDQRKGVFHKLNPKEKLSYIQHSVQKDSKLRELLIGLVLGHFTLEEWEKYLAEEKAIRKRMIDLLVQRIQDGIKHTFHSP